MQEKASIEDFSETEINILKLILETGIETAKRDLIGNLNKETNNLEYENKTNSINITLNLLKADRTNTINQLYEYIKQIVAIKKFNEYAVKIFGGNISLEFNVLFEHKKRQFLVETANFFIRNKVELFESIENTIFSFPNIKKPLLLFVNDLCGIEPSKFAIGIYNNLYNNLPLSINSSSYNIEVENLLIANTFNICEHYYPKREKIILDGYGIYKPEFKHLKLLCQEKRALVKKFNDPLEISEKFKLMKAIEKINDQIAVSKSNCLEISKQALQAIDKQNQKNNQQQK